MQTAIDLTRFCFGENYGRYAIASPWVKCGRKYATDGVVLVAADTDEPSTDLSGKKVPGVEKLLTPVDGDWQPWPSVARCGLCEGSGDKMQICPGCECGMCDGSETYTVFCDCRGERIQEFGVQHISRHYATLVGGLPRVEFLPTTDSESPLRFRFDGGEGALMGMKPEGQ